MSLRHARLAVSLAALALLVATAFIATRPAAPPTVGEGPEVRIASRARTQQMRTEAAPWTAMREAAPAPAGWTSETRLAKNNDWEPAVAIDPAGQYIYILTTRYGAKVCDTCRKNGLALIRSTDAGATWEPWEWLYEGGGWQADPQIVVDGTGVVHAAILVNPFLVKYTRSTDNGVTWSTPVSVHGNDGPSWGDHEWLAVSPDGMDVYIGFNHHQNWQVTSNDGGITWNEPIMTSDPMDEDYYFSNGAVVLPDESVVFVATEFACCPYNDLAHKKPVDVWAIRSTDHGATWTQTKLDTMAAPPPCKIDHCPKAWWGSLPAIGVDDDGDLLATYSGGHAKFGKTQTWYRTSTDGGATWDAPVALSPPAIGGFPMAVGDADGRFGVAWTDDQKAKGMFNVWYRETTDHGATWTDQVRLSNVGGGQPYKHKKGFGFNYGDYGEMDVEPDGDVFVIWAESASWWGPGTTWFSRQT